MAITSSEKSLHTTSEKKILKATCILHEGFSMGKTFKWSVAIQLNHLFMQIVQFAIRLGTHQHTLAHIGTHQFTLALIGTHWYILEHIGTYWHTLVHMVCDIFLPSSSLMHLLLFASLVYWQVKCRILYVNANKKTVGVSLQETTVLHKTATFGQWSVGDVVDDAAVFRVDQKMGLFLNLSNGILGFTHVSFIN